jgi:hypothetical protein
VQRTKKEKLVCIFVTLLCERIKENGQTVYEMLAWIFAVVTTVTMISTAIE